MIVLFAGVLAGVAFVLLVRVLWAKTQPTNLSMALTTAAVVLVAGLGLLAATGRMHWLVALGAAIFPFIRRALSLLRFWPLFRQFIPRSAAAGGLGAGAAGADGPGHSEVATSELRMTLHHASGHMDGEVLTGEFAGRLLSELDLEQLRSLRASLRDTESSRLLDSYLDRHFAGWSGSERDSQPGGRAPANGDEMTPEHALDVLGLEAGASEEDVIEAHRRLIQRLHPDRGGSSFLAATLNEAKRTLLKG